MDQYHLHFWRYSRNIRNHSHKYRYGATSDDQRFEPICEVFEPISRYNDLPRFQGFSVTPLSPSLSLTRSFVLPLSFWALCVIRGWFLINPSTPLINDRCPFPFYDQRFRSPLIDADHHRFSPLFTLWLNGDRVSRADR